MQKPDCMACWHRVIPRDGEAQSGPELRSLVWFDSRIHFISVSVAFPTYGSHKRNVCGTAAL